MNIRYGRVLVKAGWDRGWKYQEVLVKEEDGDLYYYLGRETAYTADGFVALPEEYRDKVRWHAAEEAV